ncbi:spore cortex biosynthesis protein YabQ [Laedolimicola sp.]|uniref:spore cortex biosynthesis protein YabQ n=1 Tax=Laedolimicola sp. TaxID=2981663 RepID=UPI003F817025
MAGGILFELQFFGKAFLCGAALAFLYGGLKVFRQLIFHGTVWMAAEDLAYWLLCGFLIFRMLYRENSGAVRGFAVAAVVLGMLSWLLLSKMFRNIVNFIRKKLHKCIKKIIIK